MSLRQVLFVAALLSTSLAAHADPVQFSYAGLDNQGIEQTVSFVIPSSPTVFNNYPGLRFYIDDISVVIDGITYNNSSVSFGSSVPTFGGVAGTSSDGFGAFHLITPALFSGTTADPTFVLGTYAVNGAQINADLLSLPLTSPGTLTVTSFQPSSVTPEPSSWLLLGTGALALSWLGSRRERVLGRS